MNWLGGIAESVSVSIGDTMFGEENAASEGEEKPKSRRLSSRMKGTKRDSQFQQRNPARQHPQPSPPRNGISPRNASPSRNASPARGDVRNPLAKKASKKHVQEMTPIEASSISKKKGKKKASFDMGELPEEETVKPKKHGNAKGQTFALDQFFPEEESKTKTSKIKGNGGKKKPVRFSQFAAEQEAKHNDAPQQRMASKSSSKSNLMGSFNKNERDKAQLNARKSFFGLGVGSMLGYGTEEPPLRPPSYDETGPSSLSSMGDYGEFEIEEEEEEGEEEEEESEEAVSSEEEDKEDILNNEDDGDDFDNSSSAEGGLEKEIGAEADQDQDLLDDYEDDSDADGDDDLSVLDDPKFSIKSTSSKKRAFRVLGKALKAARGHLPQAKFIGPNFGAGPKWCGGCRCPDGRIFFAPRNADQVLCVDPAKSSVALFGDSLAFKWDLSGKKSGKFSDVVTAPDGQHLFLIPASARFVIRMDLRNGRAHIIGDDLGGGDWKWGRAVICDGKIFCAPGSAGKVLMIDPVNETTTLIGTDYGSATAKWGGAVLVPMSNPGAEGVGFDGVDTIIIFTPTNASRVLALDPVNLKTAMVGDDLGDEQYKYDGACLGADGAVYCAPVSANQALRIEFAGRVSDLSSISTELAELQSIANSTDKSLSMQQALRMKLLGVQLKDTKKSRQSVFQSEELGDVRDESHKGMLPWKYNIEFLKSHYLVAENVRSTGSPVKQPNNLLKQPSALNLGDGEEGDLQGKHTSTKLAKMLGVTDSKLIEVSDWCPNVTTKLIGPSRGGNYKYSDTVMSTDGRTVIGVPLNFTFFIAIDTATPQHAVARIGPRLEAKPKRLRCGSGVMGLDGYMYCAPLRAKRVLRLDALSLTDAMGTTEANMLDKTKVFGWTTTALEMFVRYQCFKRGTSELPWFIDAMSERAAIVAVAAIAHWKTWAAKKARLSRGRSVNDPIVRFKDRRMKALLLKKPDVWSFGLTTVDSIRCGDLIDWLQKLHSTEDGLKFITSCGVDIKEDTVTRVARVPDLVYSVINISNRGPLLQMPMMKKALVCPDALEGDWLVRCLTDPDLMEGAVEFLELVSADLESTSVSDKANSEAKRRIVCDRIASVDDILAPMLRLPTHLQERVASSRVMIGVLDEMFIDRPVALFVVSLDFCCVVSMLILVLKLSWHVQHPGPLTLGECGQAVFIIFANSYYLFREVKNARAMSRLGLQIDTQDVMDFITISVVFLLIVLSVSPPARMSTSFQIVASLASGLCWLKLLGFIAGFNLKFALYYKSLIHITFALQSFVSILFLVLGMFASMFYLILNKRQWEGNTPADDSDDTFSTIGESFITLFRMMLGDFDRDWFTQRTADIDAFATGLFIVYMVIVFIVMLNVLIAVVCDNYDYAMSKSRELFLRARLTLVAGLELQGYTVKRPKIRGNGHHVSESTEIASRQSFSTQRASRSISMSASAHGAAAGGKEKKKGVKMCVRLTGLSGADRLDRFLRMSLWHKGMRKMLQLRYMFDDTGGEEDWNGRVKHLEREVTNIVNKRVSQAEERLIRAFEQHMERRETQMEKMEKSKLTKEKEMSKTLPRQLSQNK